MAQPDFDAERNGLVHGPAPACERPSPDLVLFHGGGLVSGVTWWYCRRHHGAGADSERGPL